MSSDEYLSDAAGGHIYALHCSLHQLQHKNYAPSPGTHYKPPIP